MLVWKNPYQCLSSCCLWGQLCPSFSTKQQNNSPRNLILCHTSCHSLFDTQPQLGSPLLRCQRLHLSLPIQHHVHNAVTVKFWSYLRNILVWIFSQALCIPEISSEFAHIESLHMKENTFELFGTYSILFSRSVHKCLWYSAEIEHTNYSITKD